MSYFRKMMILGAVIALSACGLSNDETDSALDEIVEADVSETPAEMVEKEEPEADGQSEENEVADEVSETSKQPPLVEYDVPSLYEELNGKLFTFDLGRGGWMTAFTFEEEGKFTGNYYDYNNVERSESEFEGKFTIHEQIDAHTYRMTLDVFNITSETGKEEVKWDLPTTYVDGAHGFPDESYEFELYLPSKPKSDVTEEYLSWVYGQANNGDDFLNTFGVYNLEPEFGMEEIVN